MVPDNSCRRIVQVIHGQSTGGDDDVYVCADGSRWQRIPYSERNGTAAEQRAYLHGNRVCDHK